MDRVLEPELMDDDEQSAAYAAADFSASNQWFADRVASASPGTSHEGPATPARRAVDLGCGPADVLVRLAAAARDVHVTGVDGSAPMIALGRDAIRREGLDGRVELIVARIPAAVLPAHGFDLVLSKDLLHHLPDPAMLWAEVRRLGRPGAYVAVMDLMRPASPEAARDLTTRVAGDAPPVLRTDFYNSLLAAFTPDEVRAQLQRAGLAFAVEQVSDRHMLVDGCLP